MPTGKDTMVRAERLSKSYGSFRAVHELSFEVLRGEVVGFLGPNGAGKSTTLRMLSGFLGATSGEAWVNGYSVVEEGDKARESIGYMPESAPLYVEMRVREYLAFRAELKRVPSGKRRAQIERALEAATLVDVADVIIGQLSKGYRQRVGLADALVSSPPLLILDEPTAGLDPNQIREVRALIEELSAEHTILLSTHILSEVEAVCTRAVVIARGELVAEGTLAELRALQKPSGVSIRARSDGAALRALLGERSLVSRVDVGDSVDGTTTVHASFLDESRGEEAVIGCVAALVSAGIGVLSVTPQSGLEHVFAMLTKEAAPPKKRGKRP
jgi:ABC-2 type transport system ATP-binding protein